MTTVAIGKRVNPNQLVMKARRDFIKQVGFVFNPVFGVVNQLAQLDLDLPGIDANITICLADFPGPFPDLAKHTFV